MKLIREIIEPGEFKDDAQYRIRRAVRAVVKDDQEKVALLHMANNGYYKLPGGGIDEGEKLMTAFNREMKEELGCSVAVFRLDERAPRPYGMTIEYRHSMGLVQISYVFMGKVNGKKGQVDYTEKEIAEGASLVWVSAQEAIDLLEKSTPTTESGKFIVERDLAIAQSVLWKEIKNAA